MLDKPRQEARQGVQVKLLAEHGELHVFAQSLDRVKGTRYASAPAEAASTNRRHEGLARGAADEARRRALEGAQRLAPISPTAIQDSSGSTISSSSPSERARKVRCRSTRPLLISQEYSPLRLALRCIVRRRTMICAIRPQRTHRANLHRCSKCRLIYRLISNGLISLRCGSQTTGDLHRTRTLRHRQRQLTSKTAQAAASPCRGRSTDERGLVSAP